MAWKRRKVRSRPAGQCQYPYLIRTCIFDDENERLTGVGPEPDDLFNESRHFEVIINSFIH